MTKKKGSDLKKIIIAGLILVGLYLGWQAYSGEGVFVEAGAHQSVKLLGHRVRYEYNDCPRDVRWNFGNFTLQAGENNVVLDTMTFHIGRFRKHEVNIVKKVYFYDVSGRLIGTDEPRKIDNRWTVTLKPEKGDVVIAAYTKWHLRVEADFDLIDGNAVGTKQVFLSLRQAPFRAIVIKETPDQNYSVTRLKGAPGKSYNIRFNCKKKPQEPVPVRGSTPPNFKVAFIADASIGFWKEGRRLSGSNARGVLQLIKDEGAEMVLYQGDLGYGVETNIAVVETFESQINDILGENFPIFWSIGNHDVGNWYREGGYQDKMRERMARIDGVSCSGDLGVKSTCKYKGLFWIFVAPGIFRGDTTNYADYITEQLDVDDSLWSVCSWHKNQGKMQISFLGNETGWGVYESCREEGGIVATGHAHSYSRTHLMDNFSEQSIASTSNTLEIEKGKTFAFVSGIGGSNFHGQKKSGDWWASIYTRGGKITTNTGNTDLFGALFCTFHVDGQPYKAKCYLKNIRGEIIDEFSLISKLGQ